MSKPDLQRIPDYLAHILEAIHRIDIYTSDMTEAVFLQNQLVQDAVIRNFETATKSSSSNMVNFFPLLNSVIQSRWRRVARPGLSA